MKIYIRDYKFSYEWGFGNVPLVSQITNICSNIIKKFELARIYTDESYRGEACSLIRIFPR